MQRPYALVHLEAAHLPAGPSPPSGRSDTPSSPLHQVFQLLDVDGGGTLSLREFREVRRCRLTVLKPVLKAPMVSALETIII